MIKRKAQNYGNWYQQTKNKDLQQVHGLLDQGVYIALVNAKKAPEMRKHFTNYEIQKEFMRCEQAAQKTLQNISMGQRDAGKQTLQYLIDGLQNLCIKVNCKQMPAFSEIMENANNARILIQNLV